MKKSRLSKVAAACVAALAFLAGSLIASSGLSNAAGTTTKVCVNKTSKVIYYKSKCSPAETSLMLQAEGEIGPPGASAYEIWKNTGNVGSPEEFLASLKGPAGPAGPVGPAGQNGAASPISAGGAWDIGLNCNQKMAAAESAGYVWVLKQHRTNFEQKTGCTVEQTTSNPDNETFRQAGLVYVENWRLLTVSETVAGDGWTFGNNGVAFYNAVYSISVANLGAGIVPCSMSNSTRIYKGAGPYEYLVELYLREQPNKLTAEINFGLTDGNNDCGKYDIYDYPAPIIVNEDPAAFTLKASWRETLRKWGW